MKAWQLITHTPSSPTYRRLRSPITPAERDLMGSFRNTDPVWRAWETTREIAHILQASMVVFQCPASFQPTAGNLENFGKFFRKLGRQAFQLAWEPRGPWPPELVYELCAEHRLIHCVDPFVNQPLFGDPLYWRLHGKGGYRYRYSDDDLGELKRMLSLRKTVHPAYVLFNNVSMREDAERFRRLF